MTRTKTITLARQLSGLSQNQVETVWTNIGSPSYDLSTLKPEEALAAIVILRHRIKQYQDVVQTLSARTKRRNYPKSYATSPPDAEQPPRRGNVHDGCESASAGTERAFSTIPRVGPQPRPL